MNSNLMAYRITRAQFAAQREARELVRIAEIHEYAVWLRYGSDEEYEAAESALELAVEYAESLGVVLI